MLRNDECFQGYIQNKNKKEFLFGINDLKLSKKKMKKEKEKKGRGQRTLKYCFLFSWVFQLFAALVGNVYKLLRQLQNH